MKNKITIPEYYTKIDALKASKNLSFFERMDWYKEKIMELRAMLSDKDRKKVEEDQKRWDDKVQSSIS